MSSSSAHRHSSAHSSSSSVTATEHPLQGEQASPLPPVPAPVQPPRYVSSVERPTPSPAAEGSGSPTYPSIPSPARLTPASPSSERLPTYSDHSHSHSLDELPTYAEEPATEPKTLSRGLWSWGFLCPLLWIIGFSIMWIPLTPLEPEQDAEKAQQLEEMIAILRVTELKYSKRCGISLAVLMALILVVVIIAVVVSRT
ncbi:hypothetical protein P7C73_g1347, partial [Tremellales sp. Uapishka_1]